jgi:hypothetical protein
MAPRWDQAAGVVAAGLVDAGNSVGGVTGFPQKVPVWAVGVSARRRACCDRCRDGRLRGTSPDIETHKQNQQNCDCGIVDRNLCRIARSFRSLLSYWFGFNSARGFFIQADSLFGIDAQTLRVCPNETAIEYSARENVELFVLNRHQESRTDSRFFSDPVDRNVLRFPCLLKACAKFKHL